MCVFSLASTAARAFGFALVHMLRSEVGVTDVITDYQNKRSRRMWPGLLCVPFVFALRSATQSTLASTTGSAVACRHPSALPNATQALDDLYTDLLSSVNASAWPDAEAQSKLWRGLRRSADNRTVEPTVFESDGPLQVVCFLQQSAVAMRLVADAKKHVFEPFLAELRAGLSAEALAVVDRGTFVPKPSALHTVVLVFSEHPSLLDATERSQWHAVPEATVATLGEALRAPIEARCALRLRLAGYAITPDGSMLLLLDEADGGSSMLELRNELQSLGTTSLGSLNTRPKKLIHVSAMRLLEWPFDSLTPADEAHVQAVVGAWTAALGNHTLPDGSPLPNLSDGHGEETTVTADHIELVRDTQWMMTRHHSYAQYTLSEDSQGAHAAQHRDQYRVREKARGRHSTAMNWEERERRRARLAEAVREWQAGDVGPNEL